MDERTFDEKLVYLASVVALDLESCRAALLSCDGDLDAAATALLLDGQGQPQSNRGADRGSGAEHAAAGCAPRLCERCGSADASGYFGEGEFSSHFYCGVCWGQWDHAEPIPAASFDDDGGIMERFLGLIEGRDWFEVGKRYVAATTSRRKVPLLRMTAQLASGPGGEGRWRAIAEAARSTVDSRGASDFGIAAAFLRGAAHTAGIEFWQVLTIYEMQVADLLATRHKRSRWSAPSVAGCTGLSCGASGLVGQTEEVDVHVYDYGKQDVVVRLRSSHLQNSALLYDPASTFCPIGIGVSGLCVTRFTLYPHQLHAATGVGIPLTLILWELLLSERNLNQAVTLLRSLFSNPQVPEPMMAGASLLLSQPGHGIVIVEWSRSALWVSPVTREGILVHANHCVFGSTLTDNNAEEVHGLIEDSRGRQASVEDFFAGELLAGRGAALSLPQIKTALSLSAVQNDDVLSTVVLSPLERSLHVRLRLQNQGMQLVENTVACDFWQCFSDMDENASAA